MQVDVDEVIEEADRRFWEFVNLIVTFVRYAPVSQGGPNGPTAKNVYRLADAILNYLEELPELHRPTRCFLQSLPDSETRGGEGAFPLVVAEWFFGADLPTLLIYGHGDVVVVDAAEWTKISSPFEAAVLTVNGEKRLYGRGCSDDMGGWISHLAALQAWLAVYGKAPINVRLILEFEEEIGSVNLLSHLDKLGDFCEVDAMVLTDCENPSPSTPGITVSLRGLATADVVCTTDLGGHSGLYGGVRADPSNALMQVVARLTDRDGHPTIGLVDLPEPERKALARVAMESNLPAGGRSNAERAWQQAAVTVVGTTLPSIDPASLRAPDAPRPANRIRTRVAARLSIRVPPRLSVKALLDEVRAVVTANPPPGITVALEPVEGELANVEPWHYDPPDCVAFQAVGRAYERVWGTPLRVGVGGSIGFIPAFGDRFGDRVVLVLNGVLEPESALHMADESLLLEVFRKAIRANICLLAELGAIPKGDFMRPVADGGA